MVSFVCNNAKLLLLKFQMLWDQYNLMTLFWLLMIFGIGWYLKFE